MKKLLLSPSFILGTLGVAFLYIVFTVWIINFKLVLFTLQSPYQDAAKLQILWSLILGLFTSFPVFNIVLLIISGLLTGANLLLLQKKMKTMKENNEIKFAVSGGLLLGVLGSGCAACGLPIISLLGLSGSFFTLPFQGYDLPLLSIILLSVSLYFLIRSHQKILCEIPARKSAKS